MKCNEILEKVLKKYDAMSGKELCDYLKKNGIETSTYVQGSVGSIIFLESQDVNQIADFSMDIKSSDVTQVKMFESLSGFVFSYKKSSSLREFECSEGAA